MALLVTIGNICILGNFQLGIWGKFAIPTVWWTSNKLKYTDFHSIKFGGINTRTAVKMAAHCGVIVMLDVMVMTLEAGQ